MISPTPLDSIATPRNATSRPVSGGAGFHRFLPGIAGALAAGLSLVPLLAAPIEFLRLPPGGMQPQLAVDTRQDIHCLWLDGEPASANVRYARIDSTNGFPTRQIQVNSQAGSALAIGTIRGPQFALGPSGTVHVVWNGSGTATPKPPKGSPLLYSRLVPGSAGFEPQRNLIHGTADLDGGGGIAADPAGRVFAFWHAGDGQMQTREDRRKVYVAESIDDGATFSPERPITRDGGACGCCGLRAGTDSAGQLFVTYRGARELIHRETIVLQSNDAGVSFQSSPLQDWATGSCPMSLPAIGRNGLTTQIAWETEGRIYLQTFPAGPSPSTLPAAPQAAVVPGPGARLPALASNSRGETLLVWTEGTGWNRGGRLGWRLLDRFGTPTSQGGVREGIPVWSYAAVVARPDNSFLVVY